MSERELEEWMELGRFVDGECTPEEEASIRARLERDPELRAMLRAARAVEADLRDADPAGVPDAARTEALLASIRRRRSVRSRRPWAIAIAVAATLLAGLAILPLLLRSLREDRARPPEQIADSGTPDRGRGIANGDRAPDADPEAEPGRGVEPALDLGPDPYRGVLTLAVVDDRWPEEARRRAREILESRQAEFEAVGAAGAESIHREVARLGRDAVPVLLEALDDPDPACADLAFEMLLRSEDPSSYAALASHAERKGGVDRLLRAFGRNASEECLPFVVEVARSDPAHAAEASRVLSHIGTPAAVAALVEIAREGGDAAGAAVAALGSMHDRRSAAAVLELHEESPDDPVIELALGRRARHLAPALRRELASSEDDWQRRAIRLLGRMRDRDSVGALVDHVRSGRFVDEAIVAALRAGGSAVIDDVFPWIDVPLDPSAAREETLRSIARALDDAGLARLQRIAAASKGPRGMRAARLLAFAGSRAVGRLAELARENRHFVDAVHSLASVGTDSARSALTNVARGKLGLRVIATLLRGGHDPIAVDVLRRIAREDPDAASRILARIERDRDLQGRVSREAVGLP